MTKRGYTDITILLDRSGSMASRRDDTIGGLLTFIEEQKRLSALLKKDDPDMPGESKLTFAQFDDVYEPVFVAVPIPSVQLDPATYIPRGGTALFDAIARCVGNTAARLGLLALDEQPEKTIFVIITDGEENTSREVGAAGVKELVELQKKAGVEFIFLGANIDAFAAGGAVGMRGTNYVANAVGIGQSFSYTSAMVGSSRLASGGRQGAASVYAGMAGSMSVDDDAAVRGVAAFQAMVGGAPVGGPVTTSGCLVDHAGVPFVMPPVKPEVIGKKAKRPSKRA